jgi:small subunit ribosomal protein S20
MLRSQIKKVLTAIEAKNAAQAKEAFAAAVPVIDRMANKGIIHKNKAARHKSRLAAKINSL